MHLVHEKVQIVAVINCGKGITPLDKKVTGLELALRHFQILFWLASLENKRVKLLSN
jgi:hypothetical protein